MNVATRNLSPPPPVHLPPCETRMTLNKRGGKRNVIPGDPSDRFPEKQPRTGGVLLLPYRRADTFINRRRAGSGVLSTNA